MSPSPTPYHVFAVAGAIGGSGNDGPQGNLGSFIVNELIKAGTNVRVLARAASVSSMWSTQGVTLSLLTPFLPG